MDTMGRVKELSETRGWSLYKLASESCVPYSTLKSKNTYGGQLSVDTIELICNALGISLSEFFATA